MRPLPTVSHRPLPDGPLYFVDAQNGDDKSEGTKQQPWRTLAHATSHLKAGDTLCLRAGVYYEHLRCRLRGAADKPICLRSYPGELAIIDGGLAEFAQAPETAWQPVAAGAEGEFRSVRAFPELNVRRDATNLLGNFSESMVPLHGYRFVSDLRSGNHSFHRLAGSKTAAGDGLYCGPGVFLEPTTARIHVRLAHTNQPSIGESNNYRGETDPRKTPLVIAGRVSPLVMERSSHVILQDVVVRGSCGPTMEILNCDNITLDGLTAYGGAAALRIESTSGLRCLNSAFRGIAAPWLWRWSLKYRSIEARIISASQWNPPASGNRDFEFAYCEFTDCVDGVFIGNVESVSIHHCLLDNLSDDGFFITCRTAYDGSTPGGDFRLQHNRISRVLSALAFGVGHGRQRTIDASGGKQLGAPTVIRHNVFDLREPVLYQQPIEGPIAHFGRLCGDHGSPAWEPIDFIENTVFCRSSPWRNYYAAGLSRAMGKGTRRRILRNQFIHEMGSPGDVLPSKVVNLTAQQNLHFSRDAGAAAKDSFLRRFRSSALFEETGWTEGDRFAAPGESPAGIGAPGDSPIGVGGRLLLYGGANKRNSAGVVDSAHDAPPKPRWTMKPFRFPARKASSRKAAIVMGYPAFDAPLLEFALTKAGFDVQRFERQWLPAARYQDFDVVAVLGSTVRAKMTPSGFARDEHDVLRSYLSQGGTLLIGRELGQQLFPGQAGQEFLESLWGNPKRAKPNGFQLLAGDHPWIKHMPNGDWLENTPLSAIRMTKGENLIGAPQIGKSVLAETKLGRGAVIYVGWNVSHFLPSGRRPSSLEQESAYQIQYEVYANIARDLYRRVGYQR